LVANINLHPVGNVVASIVSFHEQALGAHNLINQSRNSAELIRRYELLNQVLIGFTGSRCCRLTRRHLLNSMC